MDQERRGRDRCPTCQGPTKELAGGDIRCRNSLCSYNHRKEKCPRCSHQGPDVSSAKGDSYSYSCPECLNKWNKEAV